MSAQVDKAVGELFRTLESRFRKIADDHQAQVESKVAALELVASMNVRATQESLLRLQEECIALGKLRGSTDAYDDAAKTMGVLAEKYETRHVARTTVVF